MTPMERIEFELIEIECTDESKYIIPINDINEIILADLKDAFHYTNKSVKHMLFQSLYIAGYINIVFKYREDLKTLRGKKIKYINIMNICRSFPEGYITKQILCNIDTYQEIDLDDNTMNIIIKKGR